jgi:ABC-type transport system substrate-binding protein
LGSAGGGTLVVGYTADPNTLDPWKATQFQAVHLLEQVYGTLTQLDGGLNVVPGLAEKWHALNGGRPDPDGMYGRYFTSTGNLNKVAGYSSPELDRLFAEGKATTDVAKRKEIYNQCLPRRRSASSGWAAHHPRPH